MMKRQTNRHTVLLAAGLLVAGTAAAVAETVAALSIDISGTVTFEGGAVIPKGVIEIYLEDPAVQNNARELASKMRFESTGKSKAIAFSFSLTTSVTASTTLQIVARLERGDGWLLARGSAKVRAHSACDITLYTAMY